MADEVRIYQSAVEVLRVESGVDSAYSTAQTRIYQSAVEVLRSSSNDLTTTDNPTQITANLA